MLEHYTIFLDHIHRYSFVIYHSKDKLCGLDPVKEHKNFSRYGIPRKLTKLRERFAIEPKCSESISQLYMTRNCLTHDMGVVNKKCCRGNPELILTWRGIDTVMIGSESGAIRVYPNFMGRPTRECATIALHFVDRERRFPIGQKIRLSQQDLAEICDFFARIAIPTAVQSFVVFLKANGVQVSGQTASTE